MMTLPKKCIAINSLRGWLLALCVAPALAGTAIGTVTQVNGPLLLQRADGSIKAITLNSFVEQGDTLVTEKNTYAQLKFADHSEVTLKPNTQLKIEALVDTAGAANSLDTVFSMRTGAIQIKTGAAARAKPESIKLVMPNLRDPAASLTVDRTAGTTFVVEFVEGSTASQLATRYPAVQLAAAGSSHRTDAPPFYLAQGWDAQQLAQLNIPSPTSGSGLAPGLYVHVIDGMIQLSNRGGVQQFAAGQFGYTASFIKPPVVLPNNPGIQFTPPPAFQSSTAPQGNSSSSKSKTVDCEVR